MVRSDYNGNREIIYDSNKEDDYYGGDDIIANNSNNYNYKNNKEQANQLPDPNLSDTIEMESDDEKNVVDKEIKDNNKANNDNQYAPIINSNTELQDNKKQYIIKYNVIKLQIEKTIGEELFRKINAYYQEISNSKSYCSDDSDKFDAYIKKLIQKPDVYNKVHFIITK